MAERPASAVDQDGTGTEPTGAPRTSPSDEASTPVPPPSPASPAGAITGRPAPHPRGVAVALVLALVAMATGVWSFQRTDMALRRTDRMATELEASRSDGRALASKVGALEAAADNRLDPADLAETVRASVFTIIGSAGRGSGWVAGTDGGRSLLVTNFHVVGPGSQTGTRVEVIREALRVDGEVVQVDEPRDLAVVAIDRPVPALPLASALPRVGDPVMVVGTPLGLEQSVVTGIVSAFRGEQIQISAPLNPGNSGGPVVDASGRVVAVAELRVGDETTEGIGLAIPVAQVCTLITC